MLTRETIIGNIEMMEEMRVNYNARLHRLPQGTIYYKVQHGKARPHRWLNGKETYLSCDEADLIEGLTNRMEIERALKILEENIALLRDLLDGYRNPEEGIPTGLNLCLLDGQRRIKTESEITRIIDQWYQVKTGNPKHDPGTNVASDGTLVKSRAELLGYEFLKMRGLDFKYEHPVMIDGELWYPDFMIIRKKDNAVFLWEHFGMMDKPKYRELAERKLYGYACAGFFPLKNLLITYDFGDDSIDLVWVTKMMELFEIL